jgi:hypothetical protein
MALLMALVPEFNSQIPIWFPHLRRRRQRRGNRDALRLDVSRNLIFRVGSFPHSSGAGLTDDGRGLGGTSMVFGVAVSFFATWPSAA